MWMHFFPLCILLTHTLMHPVYEVNLRTCSDRLWGKKTAGRWYDSDSTSSQTEENHLTEGFLDIWEFVWDTRLICFKLSNKRGALVFLMLCMCFNLTEGFEQTEECFLCYVWLFFLPLLYYTQKGLRVINHQCTGRGVTIFQQIEILI